MTDGHKKTLRKRATTAVIVLILLIPWFAPGLAIKGLDGVLTVVDAYMERGPLPSNSRCGGPRFDTFDVSVFYLRGLLNGKGADYGYERSRDTMLSYNSARCEAMDRWLHNRGFPSLAETEAMQALRGPVLTVYELKSSDPGFQTAYSVYSFVTAEPSDATMPFFHDPNPLTQIIVDRLTSALPEFEDPQAQGRIAQLVQQYPTACLDVAGGQGFALQIFVKPAESSHWVMPLPKLRMLAAGVSIYACLEKEQPECSSYPLGEEAPDLSLLAIENLLVQCRLATEARIAEGMRYDQWVYDAHPELSAPAQTRY